MPSKKVRSKNTNKTKAVKIPNKRKMHTMVAYFYKGSGVPTALPLELHEQQKRLIMSKYPKNYTQEDIDFYVGQLDYIEQKIADRTGIGNIIKNDVISDKDTQIFIMNVIWLTETGKLPNDNNNGYLFVKKDFII